MTHQQLVCNDATSSMNWSYIFHGCCPLNSWHSILPELTDTLTLWKNRLRLRCILDKKVILLQMDSTYRSIPATTTFTLILCSVVYLAYLFGLKNTIVQNPDFKRFSPTIGQTNLWNENPKFSKVSVC